jgi:hypothetical protein
MFLLVFAPAALLALLFDCQLYYYMSTIRAPCATRFQFVGTIATGFCCVGSQMGPNLRKRQGHFKILCKNNYWDTNWSTGRSGWPTVHLDNTYSTHKQSSKKNIRDDRQLQAKPADGRANGTRSVAWNDPNLSKYEGHSKSLHSTTLCNSTPNCFY